MDSDQTPLNTPSRVLVTGGAGFIGGNFIHHLIADSDAEVANLDLLTYAGNRETLADIESNPRYRFVQGDIADRDVVQAADRGISSRLHRQLRSRKPCRPLDRRTRRLHPHQYRRHLQPAGPRPGLLAHLNDADKAAFRFLHVSTDEVYGSLGETGAFTEQTPYAPSSPYSASKASSDHLVQAWHHTYGLPTLTTNCSNNYGPYQYPEKLIPLMILNALAGKPLPIYGTGNNVRDWLFVEDHCRAIWHVVNHGVPGQMYNVGGNSEKTNLEVVDTLCTLLDELVPDSRTGRMRN